MSRREVVLTAVYLLILAGGSHLCYLAGVYDGRIAAFQAQAEYERTHWTAPAPMPSGPDTTQTLGVAEAPPPP